MGYVIPSRSQIVPAAVLSATDQAAAILAKAEAEAEAIRNGVESIRKEAEAAGFAEGVRQGRDQGHAEVLAVLAAAEAHVRSKHLKAREAGIVIGRKLAEKILGRMMAMDAAIVADLAEQALLASRPRGGEVVVHTHPDDLEALTAARAGWLSKLAHVTGIRVVSDPTLARGDCVVDTPVGRLDGRLSTQLDALEELLRKAVVESGET